MGDGKVLSFVGFKGDGRRKSDEFYGFVSDD